MAMAIASVIRGSVATPGCAGARLPRRGGPLAVTRLGGRARGEARRVALSRALPSDDGAKSSEPWKSELGNSVSNFDDFDAEALREDIEALNKKEALKKFKSSKYYGSESSAEEGSSSSSFREWLDKFLVADFFFVLAALAWLLVGVGFKWGADDSRIVDFWLSLWNPLFQPAIGILMAGAIVSSWGKNSGGEKP